MTERLNWTELNWVSRLFCPSNFELVRSYNHLGHIVKINPCIYIISIHAHIYQFSSIAQSCLTLCNPLDCKTPGLPVHHQLPELTQTCPLSQWCHPTISSSVVPFWRRRGHLQSFPASGSFLVSQFFASDGQSIGVSASVLPMNIQDFFPLGQTGWISLLSKGSSRVFSNTTVQNHQFFGAQLSFWSNDLTSRRDY